MSDAESELDARLKARGVDTATLCTDSKGSIAVTPPTGEAPATRLPSLSLEEGAPGDFKVLGSLGRGGMGEVLLATQVALLRDVAVKRPRANGHEGASSLVREALALGRLEHPNIVPVHLMGRTADGMPLLVMKRIEGIAWSALLSDPTAAERFAGGEGDLTGWHLDVFMKVCNAVHFAHSREVLHRDIKPENVMIGAFGEVYVVDWGVAVSMRDDDVIPRARDVRGLVGTPDCMAPEMVIADGAQIGPRTDVYLLGATLHRVITGASRHCGPTMLHRLSSAALSDPVAYGHEVPPELATICNRAMARSPKDRFPDAESLRRAVSSYLQHRSAHSLAAEAERYAAELLALLALPERTAALDRARHDLLSACRFGFQQALALHADNPAAREGLQRALAAMIEHECGRDNPAAAEGLLAGLPVPDAALSERVAALSERLRTRDARLVELERLRADIDVSGATRNTSRFVTQQAAFWGAVALGITLMERRTNWRVGYPEAIASMVVFACMMTSISTWLRRWRTTNAAQRRALVANSLAAWSFVAYWLLAHALGVAFATAVPMFMVMVAALWMTVSVLFDLRGLGMCVAFTLGAAAASMWPAWSVAALSLSTATGFLSLSYAWGKSGSPAP